MEIKGTSPLLQDPVYINVLGEFDFGERGNDMSDFLHLKEYIHTAKEEDMFVIVRPGPFICAEFEFGGFPSWLLREKDLEVRTSNTTFLRYVIRYFNVLLPILAALQFINGGPIIMFQVENEYANSRKHDPGYVRMLRQQMIQHGKYKSAIVFRSLRIFFISRYQRATGISR